VLTHSPLINQHTPILLHTNPSRRSPLRTIIADPPHLNLHIMLPLCILPNELELLLILQPTHTRECRKQPARSTLLPVPPSGVLRVMHIPIQSAIRARTRTLHIARPRRSKREQFIEADPAESRFQARQTSTRETDVDLNNRPYDDLAEVVGYVALGGDGDLQEDDQAHERDDGDEGAEREHAG